MYITCDGKVWVFCWIILRLDVHTIYTLTIRLTTPRLTPFTFPSHVIFLCNLYEIRGPEKNLLQGRKVC